MRFPKTDSLRSSTITSKSYPINSLSFKNQIIGNSQSKVLKEGFRGGTKPGRRHTTEG